MTSERMNPARQIIERSRAAGRLAGVRIFLLSINSRWKIEPHVMRVRRFQSDASNEAISSRSVRGAAGSSRWNILQARLVVRFGDALVNLPIRLLSRF